MDHIVPNSADDVATESQHRSTRIEQVLRRYPPDQRFVRFSFDWSREGYLVRAILTIPTGTVMALTRSPVADHRAAIDEVVEQLSAELRRHEVSVRDEVRQTKKRRRERDVASVQSHLRNQHNVGDAEGFFDMLRHLLRQLRSQARRELTIAQLEGTIRSGELAVGGLLDEVQLRAWECWNTRLPGEPLDRWLVTLLHEALDAIILSSSGSRFERLLEDNPRADESCGVPQPFNAQSPYAVENGWAMENNPYWPFADALTRDDVLPSKSSAPWNQLSAGDQERMIVNVLSQFPREQRRAFALYALEDWTINEIAEAQRRAPSQVKDDVDVVCHALSEQLQKIPAMPLKT